MSNPFINRFLDREMEKLARSEPGPHLSIRRFPHFWVPHPLPEGVSEPEAMEDYARAVALEEDRKVCLYVPGRGTVQFDRRGKIIFRLPERRE